MEETKEQIIELSQENTWNSTFKIRELMEKLSDTEIQDIVISIENVDIFNDEEKKSTLCKSF